MALFGWVAINILKNYEPWYLTALGGTLTFYFKMYEFEKVIVSPSVRCGDTNINRMHKQHDPSVASKQKNISFFLLLFSFIAHDLIWSTLIWKECRGTFHQYFSVLNSQWGTSSSL